MQNQSRVHWLDIRSWIDIVLLIFLLVTLQLHSTNADGLLSDNPSDYDIHYTVAHMAAAGIADQAYNSTTFAPIFLSDCATCRLQIKTPHTILAYFYPPTSILLLAPLGLFNHLISFLLFFCSGLVPLAWLGWRLLGWRGLAFILVSPALWMCFFAGQNGLITASILGYSVYWLQRYPFAAGAVLSLAMIKPQIAISLPAALYAGRNYKTFWSAAISAVTLIIASYFALPHTWQQAGQYINTEIGRILNTANFFVSVRFSSFYAAFRRLNTGSDIAFILHSIVALFAVFSHVWIYKRTSKIELRLIATACAALLIPPLSYDYDQPIGLLALLALLKIDKDTPLPLTMRLIIVLSYGMMMIRFIDGYGGSIMSLVAFGNLLLLLCGIRLTQIELARNPAHKAAQLNYCDAPAPALPAAPLA